MIVAEMGHVGSAAYSSDDESGRSDDDSFEASSLYGGPDDTRLRPRKDMSVAQWDAARGTAEVVVKKGKAWVATGFTRGSQHLAFLEEIVFMVEQGSLVLLEGERMIPLLEAYSLVSSPLYGCSWDNYQIYSYLRKLGYIVGRHNVLWSLPKKRPPTLTSQLESLSNQLADVKVTSGTQQRVASEFGSNSETEARTCYFPEPFEVSSDDFTRSYELVLNWVNFTEMQGYESNSSELKLVYDIYLPNARFKKSNPGIPAFSLCTSSGRPPSRSQVRALEQTSEGRAVKFASVVCDHVTIYSFDVIELPNLP